MKFNLSASIFLVIISGVSQAQGLSKGPFCEPSWSACVIGRAAADTLNSAGQLVGDANSEFYIEAIYVNKTEIAKKQGFFGEGVLGSPTESTPSLEAYVSPGDTKVMLRQLNFEAAAPTVIMSLGVLLKPIGSDDVSGGTIAREIQLNSDFKLVEQSAKTSKNKYCDPGGVFGAIVYNQTFNTSSYLLESSTVKDFSYSVTRMIVTSSYPALFGCKK